MQKRYQVFISSTFADLKEERIKITQTLMEMDCIPAGMEIFPAIDEDQFEFIKKIIDDCDYYILVIGGRYGSVSKDGLSYTEKEYHYAIERGLRVIAFLHSDVDSIPISKSEKDPVLRQKLEDFRLLVSRGRLVKPWKNAEELSGLVSLSLHKTIKTYPSIGWVRGNTINDPTLYEDLNTLRKENEELRKQISSQVNNDGKVMQELADLDDNITLKGTHSDFQHTSKWSIEITWGKLFGLISPHLIGIPSDKMVKSTLGDLLYKQLDNHLEYGDHSLNDEDFQTLKIHLQTLGLILVKLRSTIKGSANVFWSLTAFGTEVMQQLRSVKRNKKPETIS